MDRWTNSLLSECGVVGVKRVQMAARPVVRSSYRESASLPGVAAALA